MIRVSLRFGLLFLAAAICPGGVDSQSGLVADELPTSDHRDAVGPELRIRKRNGLVTFVRFRRGSARLTENVQLTPGETLAFNTRPFQPKSSLPVRIVTLWTGEVIPASCSLPVQPLRASSHLSAQLFSAHPFANKEHSRIVLKMSDVATIRQPLGTCDVCPSDSGLRPTGVWQEVENDRVPVPGYVDATTGRPWQRRTIQIPKLDGESSAGSCLIVLSGLWPATSSAVTSLSPDDDIRSGGTLTFIFVDDAGAQRQIEVSGRGETRLIVHPNGREETVAVGTRQLQLQLRVSHDLTLSSNDSILAGVQKPIGHLIAIKVAGPLTSAIGNESEEANSLILGEPLVRFARGESNDSSNVSEEIADAVRRVADSDRVILNSGDEIFGAIDAAVATVRVRVPGNGDRSLLVDRKDVAAVCFEHPEPSVGQPVTGEFARIDLVPDASCSLGGLEEAFWIRSVIRHATDEGLVTLHPLLGEVTVRWEMIRRIKPLFTGSYQLLDQGPRHPGNGYRESFSHVEPHGTVLSFNFLISTDQLAQPIFLSADIAELIPSAPGTLKATPFLDEVRAGFLATQVFLNGERAGSLNELITVRAPVSSPERARTLLPGRLLKAGPNTIEIRQTSAKDDATSFDDCELRAIAIEVEHSVAFEE